jgi:hypothetical protein
MRAKYLESAIQTFWGVIGQLPNNTDALTYIGRIKESWKPDDAKFYLDRGRDIRMGNCNTPV